MLKEPKKLLLMGTLLLLIPTFSFAHPPNNDKNKGCEFRDSKKCRQVPEGGSSAAYLLAVGATCLGAIVLRSKLSKSQ